MASVANYMTQPKVKTNKNQWTPELMGGPSVQGQPDSRTSPGYRTSANQPMMTTQTAATYPKQGVSPTRASTPPTQTPSGGNWSLPPWTPPTQQSTPSGYAPPNPALRGGAETQFFESDPNFFNPDAYKDNDAQTPNYISSALPLAQFFQNNFQYRNDFNEAARRWEAEFGQTTGNNQFQQGLATRQQMSAEEQARLAADQWNRQFGHTQYMDTQGLDLSRQQIGNQFTLGMDQNQATRDVASTYAGSNRYQADQQLAGTRYASDQDRLAAMYGADRGLDQAGLYSAAQRYAAELGLQEAQGYASAQRYGADQGLAGQLGSANIYSGAQRYQTDAEKYIAQQQNAFLYAQLQQQAQQQELERQNLMRMTAMQTYGRSQAPVAQWARGWA